MKTTVACFESQSPQTSADTSTEPACKTAPEYTKHSPTRQA